MASKKKDVFHCVNPLLLIWLVFACVTAAAHQRIIGTVTDKNTRQPIGATVKLESELLTSKRVTTTDADGRRKDSFARASW